MEYRILAAAVFAVTLGSALPALAQSVDFGNDSSPWSADGECDDPRFEGPGMTLTILLDSDNGADATDCRTAFEAGTIWLRGATPADEGTATAPDGPTKPLSNQTPAQVPGQTPGGNVVAGIDFGDDSSQWANDGECDDRRFIGVGVATALTQANVGRDATDCRTLFERDDIRRWNLADALVATDCATIDYGNDTGDYANDDQCDDPRFDGQGTSFVINPAWNGRDATDCRRLCGFGLVALRNY
ncbi:MAG: hypothetical protein IT542_07495 [Rubellimicrobium sp.]|nr:hypothetical protein [Rubellimicrobium sp.]